MEAQSTNEFLLKYLLVLNLEDLFCHKRAAYHGIFKYQLAYMWFLIFQRANKNVISTKYSVHAVQL